MQEFCSSGSVRGARGNPRSYRNKAVVVGHDTRDAIIPPPSPKSSPGTHQCPVAEQIQHQAGLEVAEGIGVDPAPHGRALSVGFDVDHDE